MANAVINLISKAKSREGSEYPASKNLPTLDELREHLQIPEVNTGRVMNFRGIVSDNNEGLHAILDEKGFVRLRSGVEMAMCMYRGQTEEHVPCVPTLGRLKTVEDQLFALCRNAAFEEAIGEHPFVRVAEQARFFGSPLYIGKQGMAQHYGMATDMLDVTGNFDVASFFAVCRWNGREKGYLPVGSSTEPGVIYRIIPALLTGIVSTDNGGEVFEYVGWQPLHRPEQQRACGIRLEKGQDLLNFPTAQRFHFRHDPDISERIWNAFDQGKALFPEDPAADLADQARRLESFTRNQVDTAWARLESWWGDKFDKEIRRQFEEQIGLEKVDNPVLSWNGLAVETNESFLNQQIIEVLRRVRYRLAA